MIFGRYFRDFGLLFHCVSTGSGDFRLIFDASGELDLEEFRRCIREGGQISEKTMSDVEIKSLFQVRFSSFGRFLRRRISCSFGFGFGFGPIFDRFSPVVFFRLVLFSPIFRLIFGSLSQNPSCLMPKSIIFELKIVAKCIIFELKIVAKFIIFD